jgi:hypothetical protein
MSISASALFIEVYDPATGDVKAKWQNFFVDKAVNGHAYRSFDSTDILMNRSANEGGLTIRMPALADSLNLFEVGLNNEWMVRVVLYELPVTTGMPSDLTNAVVVARFLGEVLGINTDLTELVVEVGTALTAISGNIPGRKVTTSLVGRLPTL